MATFDSERAAALHRELHTHLPSDPALRVKTLESLAIERGLVALRKHRRLDRGLFRPHRPQAWREGGGACLDRSGL